MRKFKFLNHFCVFCLTLQSQELYYFNVLFLNTYLTTIQTFYKLNGLSLTLFGFFVRRFG